MHKKARKTYGARRIGTVALTGMLCLGMAGTNSVPFLLSPAYAAGAEKKDNISTVPNGSEMDENQNENPEEAPKDPPSEETKEETGGNTEQKPAETPGEDTDNSQTEEADQEETDKKQDNPDTSDIPADSSSSIPETENKDNAAPSSEVKTPADSQGANQQSPEPSKNQESAENTLTKEEEKELKEEEELAKDEEEDDGTANEELVSRQTIIRLPELADDFRFWTVARVYGFAKDDLYILEEKKDDAEKVGELKKDGLMYILQTDKDGWYYVESGKVRGFVKKELVLTEEEAAPLLLRYQQEAENLSERRGNVYTGIGTVASVATPLEDWIENEAYTYLRATVNETVVDKVYALAVGDKVNIREEQSTDCRIVGKMSEGSLCYVIADQDRDWVYVESGSVRGFVKKEFLNIADNQNRLAEEIREKGENRYKKASQTVDPRKNKALYYTQTSVKSGSQQSDVRRELLTYAAQFAGNPYKWGGSSLTHGTDCSGFARAVYAKFGYHLPRTSRAQSQCGTKIAVEDVRPGDLIFYAKKGRVYHVAIYAGNGRTIEAANEDLGITSLNAFRKNAVWAVHLIKDDTVTLEESKVTEANVKEDDLGQALGDYHITWYCPCELCTDSVGTVQDKLTPLVEGNIVAVSESVAKEGEKLIINSHLYTVTNREDLEENEAAIYLSSHEKTRQLAETVATIYTQK